MNSRIKYFPNWDWSKSGVVLFEDHPGDVNSRIKYYVKSELSKNVYYNMCRDKTFSRIDIISNKMNTIGKYILIGFLCLTTLTTVCLAVSTIIFVDRYQDIKKDYYK